jgi:hypothetical protein
VFVCLAGDPPPLEQVWGSCAEEFAPHRFEDMVPLGPIYTEHWDCDWKIAMDNYLESYHVPIGHPGLFRMFTPDYEDQVNLPTGVARGISWLRERLSPRWSERMYQQLVGKVSEDLPERTAALELLQHAAELGHRRLPRPDGFLPGAAARPRQVHHPRRRVRAARCAPRNARALPEFAHQAHTGLGPRRRRRFRYTGTMRRSREEQPLGRGTFKRIQSRVPFALATAVQTEGQSMHLTFDHGVEAAAAARDQGVRRLGTGITQHAHLPAGIAHHQGPLGAGVQRHEITGLRQLGFVSDHGPRAVKQLSALQSMNLRAVVGPTGESHGAASARTVLDGRKTARKHRTQVGHATLLGHDPIDGRLGAKGEILPQDFEHSDESQGDAVGIQLHLRGLGDQVRSTSSRTNDAKLSSFCPQIS